MMCLFPVAATTMSTLLKMSSIRTTLWPSMQAWTYKIIVELGYIVVDFSLLPNRPKVKAAEIDRFSFV